MENIWGTLFRDIYDQCRTFGTTANLNEEIIRAPHRLDVQLLEKTGRLYAQPSFRDYFQTRRTQ